VLALVVMAVTVVVAVCVDITKFVAVVVENITDGVAMVL
jgi:hypothetical protein